MSNYTTRQKLEPLFKLKPNWHTFHSIGVRLQNDCVLPTHATLEEVGRHFGVSKQMAYHEVACTLGKVAFRLRKALEEPS